MLAVDLFTSLISFRGMLFVPLTTCPPLTTLYSVHFTHLSTSRHKKHPHFAPSLPLISVTTYAKKQCISNGLFSLTAKNLGIVFNNLIMTIFYTKARFLTYQLLESNAPKTTYNFYACLFFRGSIKFITGFPIGDIGHNPFFFA